MSGTSTQRVDDLIERHYDGSLKAYQYAQVVDRCQQIAGKALGYPWFKDDPKNFPDATDANGVCIGEHCDETIVEELAMAYRDAKRQIAVLQIQAGRIKEERDEARSLFVRDEAVIAENAEALLRWREAATQALLALEPLHLTSQYHAVMLGTLEHILPEAVSMLRRVIARPCQPDRETIENRWGVTYNDRHDPWNLNG